MTDYRKYILSTGTHYISNSDENGNLKGREVTNLALNQFGFSKEKYENQI